MWRAMFVMIALAAISPAQNSVSIVKQGEQVFAKTCATGYCH